MTYGTRHGNREEIILLVKGGCVLIHSVSDAFARKLTQTQGVRFVSVGIESHLRPQNRGDFSAYYLRLSVSLYLILLNICHAQVSCRKLLVYYRQESLICLHNNNVGLQLAVKPAAFEKGYNYSSDKVCSLKINGNLHSGFFENMRHYVCCSALAVRSSNEDCFLRPQPVYVTYEIRIYLKRYPPRQIGSSVSGYDFYSPGGQLGNIQCRKEF